MAAGPERDRGPQSRAASFALAAYQTRERLISWRRGAWRRRWLGVGTAWTLCLIGWTGALLLPGHEVASTEPYVDPEGNQATDAERTEIAAADAKGAVSPGAAGGGQVPDDPFLPLQASREKAASLHGDLTAALALHEARARHLAKVPRALDGGRQRNPIHEQAAIQLRQQEGLIAVLESRLAAEQARIAALEQALRGQSGTQVGSGEAGPDRAPHPRAWTVPDPQADRALANAGAEIAGGNGRPTLRHVPEPAPRLMFLAGTLAVAIAAGGAAAVWRGERDRIIDDAVQLQRFGLPVLGSIRAATTAAERRLEQVARRNLGLACLGLLGLFGSLATAEALDLLAPLRVSWLG